MKMLLISIILAACAVLCAAASDGGKAMPVVGDVKTSDDFPEPSPAMMHDYQRRLAATYLAAQRARSLAAKTPEAQKAQRVKLMTAYKRELGPFPRKTPLNAHTLGRIERDDVTIEKVVFESRPKFYVTGNLYLPKPLREGKYPTVLLLSGH
jgi:hypothetical protein